jgi:hypothetical protein
MLEFSWLGVNLYAFRIFLLLCLPVLLFAGKLRFYNNSITKYTFFFLLIWIIYATISILWCIDKTLAYKDILYLLFGLFTFIFIVSIKNGFDLFEEKLASIWTDVFIIVLIVSVWEIYTSSHLVSSLTERLYHLKPFNKLNYVPVFTFDNPNYYAIYSCVSVIIFAGMIMNKKNMALNGFLIACALFIIHLTAARLGMITFALFLFLFLIYNFSKSTKSEVKSYAISFAKFGCVMLFMLISIFCFHKTENVHDKIVTSADITPDDHLPSNVLRKNLILTGRDLFIESKGLGVGAGNYKSYIRQGLTDYQTDGIDSPHNWPLEVLSQYGIIIGAFFLLLFIYILLMIFRSSKQRGFNRKQLLLLFLIICYAIMSNANSIFISLPMNWFMLSLIAVYGDELIENNPVSDVQKN